MASRNFWLDTNIDGRKTDLSGGPRNKEGGMSLTLKQLSEGQRNDCVRIQSWSTVDKDGRIMLATRVTVFDPNTGAELYSNVLESIR